MKTIFTCLLLAACAFGQAQAQNSIKTRVTLLDKSPMDMAYFPNDYPLLKVQNKVSEPLLARIIYSRPQKNDREIFGALIPYNEIWRLGANEATEIDVFQDVYINGKKLPKGRYTMYAIPNPASWTIIFNKDTDSWGAFKYNQKNDVLRVEVPVQKLAQPADAFTIDFNRASYGADLTMAWDDVIVALPLKKK